MAVLEVLVDDIDGTMGDDIETIEFGLAGKPLVIDLKREHAEKLRGILAPFIEKARRAGTTRVRSVGGIQRPRVLKDTELHARPKADHGDGADAKAVREWAAQAGVPCSERGRIPKSVLAAYTNALLAGPRTATKSQRAAAAEEEIPVLHQPDPNDDAMVLAWGRLKGRKDAVEGKKVTGLLRAAYRREFGIPKPS